MKIILATGIYPPEIGGPATYVRQLAKELHGRGIDVTVIAYGNAPAADTADGWPVVRVSRAGGQLVRWNRYAKALQAQARDADIIEAFSSVSCGIPLVLARLKKPKNILRLGGDFLWERYTDRGGRLPLRLFYRSYPVITHSIRWLLRSFDHIIFSTRFQNELYQKTYRRLPPTSIIENALPGSDVTAHERHDPFRLLYMGRFVRFKNLPLLIHAVSMLPHIRLTLAGEGPMAKKLALLVTKRGLGGRVTFLPSVHGEEKQGLLLDHDLLVMPSITDISPHAAIEARAAGLPVLLTEETGLSHQLRDGMIIRPLRSTADITRAILEVEQGYASFARSASAPFPQKRTWEMLAEEHVGLFRSLL